MNKHELSNLLDEMRSCVAYAQTDLAELIVKGRKEVKRYASDIDGLQREVDQLERKIGDLPRLITEAEQENESKQRKARQLKVKADNMDAQSKMSDIWSTGHSIAASAALGLGFVFALPTGITF